MKSLILFSFFLLLLTSVSEAQVVDTAAVRREVDSLIQISRKRTNEGKYEDALQLLRVAEKEVEMAFGKESVLYASCIFNKGRVFHFRDELVQAEHFYLEALAIREKVLSKLHPDYASILNNLAVLYKEMGKYEKAEQYYTETLTIREQVLGKAHPDYAASLRSLALLYYDMGNYKKAEPLFVEVQTIREKTVGKAHPDYAGSLSNLAVVYMDINDYERAEQLHLESKSIWEKALGKEHPDYSKSLNNLAVLYLNMGNYEKAEPLLLEAKAVRGKVLGKEHPAYASCLMNLANLYSTMGEYEKAEPLFLEAKVILAKSKGEGLPDYAMCLMNLANLSGTMGNYEKAEPLFLEANGIFEKVLGKGHYLYAACLNNLSNLYSDLQDYEKAEQFYIEAIAVQENIFGKVHPNCALSLHNLAILYYQMGNYEKAEHLHLEALTIREKVFGKEHPDYALSLHNLASLYLNMGNYNKAEQIYLEALTIRKKILRKEHPDYAKNLNGLARFYEATGNDKEAVQYYLASNSLDQSRLFKSARHLSESELNKYVRKFSRHQDELCSFTTNTTSDSHELLRFMYSNGLFHKGFLLEAVSARNRLTQSDTAATQLDYLQKSLLRRLSSEYSKPIAKRDSARIAEWEEKANTIEKELVHTVSGYGDLIRQVSWQEVQQQLRPSEAALELVSYRYYTPFPTDSTMYAALVVLPTDTAPHFIPLFEERQLQALFTRPGLHEQLTVKGLYGSDSELLNLLWKPLEPLLRDAKTIYYSPAGLLHRINPAALRDADKRPLSEGRQWVRVGSTRELVTGRLADNSFAHDTVTSPTAAVWGGIRYDMDSIAFAAANPFDPAAEPLPEFQRKDGKFRYMVEDSSTAALTNRNGQRGSDDDSWEPLPGCEQEVQQVGELLRKAGFRTEVLSDYAASEERFKAIGQNALSPRILHVATHGFAYPDPKKEPAKTLSGAEPTYKLQDDPMLRSGLLLAGANYYWKNKHPLQNREDGVLVAYEVRDLNLRNTELAVLSACQTGLGDVVGSEGVYGLQRAFRIAGAKFLIVSLWQVPDEQTQELMRLFYENWVDKRESLRDAFNHAQTALREREPNPYMWAGFVLIE